jgi:hypothetical protein
MVGLGRLELPTSPLSGVRSNHLSYRPSRALLMTHTPGPTGDGVYFVQATCVDAPEMHLEAFSERR